MDLYKKNFNKKNNVKECMPSSVPKCYKGANMYK